MAALCVELHCPFRSLVELGPNMSSECALRVLSLGVLGLLDRRRRPEHDPASTCSLQELSAASGHDECEVIGACARTTTNAALTRMLSLMPHY